MDVPCTRLWRLLGATSARERIGGPARAVRAKPCTSTWSNPHGTWDKCKPMRSEQRRVVATDRRIGDGPPARVETLRRRSHGDGVINTAYIERLNATFRERLAPLARRCRALARHTRTLHEGMFVVGTVYNFA